MYSHFSTRFGLLYGFLPILSFLDSFFFHFLFLLLFFSLLLSFSFLLPSFFSSSFPASSSSTLFFCSFLFPFSLLFSSLFFSRAFLHLLFFFPLFFPLPLFSFFLIPSFFFTSPSPLAFQLLISVRLTQLTSLYFFLEPLDFRPFRFSPLFSLLMSTFLLLIALFLPLSNSFFTLQNTLLPSFRNRCFGHHLSLFYLRCNFSLLVRFNALIIRLAASMPTAYMSSISHSLPHFHGF